MTSLNVLHFIPSLIPESGGPARSVSGLCTALAKAGAGINLVSFDVGHHFQAPIIPPPGLVETTFVKNRLAIGLRQLYAPHFKATLDHLVCQRAIRLIHDHCIWLPSNITTSRTARQQNIPFIVSTRGMLEPWALRQGRLKKRLMWRLYQARNLKQAQLLHATSMGEAENLRRLGLNQPIAVIPNGVDVPPEALSTATAGPGEVRTLLFLSRLHPKKGLLNLVEALRRVSSNGWQVIIAGPDEGGHQAEVETAAARAGLSHMFKFIGPVDDEAKWNVYRQADLFVLPTFSENFGIVVAEALACGLPVITTTGAPWQELESRCCGWWIEPQVEPLIDALQAAMALSDAQRTEMGQRGRKLVEAKYSWPAVAEQMAAVYRWLLGQETRPDCVLV